MTPKQKLILKILGIPALYFLSLVVFVRLTFPYDTLKHRILAGYNGSQAEKRLEIEDMSGRGLFGVEAENVRLVALAPVTGEDGKPAPPNALAVDSASVSVSVLSYLFGTISVDFEAEVGGGELSGSFTQDAELAHLEVTGETIDISGLTVLAAAIGLPLGGTLSGTVDLSLPEGQMKKAEGSFALQISGLTAGDGKAKIRDTIALPKLQAGDLVFKAAVTEGRMDISELSAQGPDFELQAEGKVKLREPFDRSSVNLDTSFKFKEAYTNKSDLTRGIFGSPDSKIPALFDMDPTVRRAKAPDGSYGWRVTGLLSKPVFGPGKTSSGKKKKEPAKSAEKPEKE